MKTEIELETCTITAEAEYEYTVERSDHSVGETGEYTLASSEITRASGEVYIYEIDEYLPFDRVGGREFGRWIGSENAEKLMEQVDHDIRETDERL